MSPVFQHFTLLQNSRYVTLFDPQFRWLSRRSSLLLDEHINVYSVFYRRFLTTAWRMDVEAIGSNA
jgi:hypothetical protein